MSIEHLEGRASVLAALEARGRAVHEVLVARESKPEKVREVLEAAGRRGVPVRRVALDEIGKLAHGKTHGGVIAVCSPRLPTTPEELMKIIRGLSEPPLLLLLDGVDDPRNLGMCLRTAEALGAHAVLVRKRAWDFDPVEVARPSSGAFERLPLVLFDGPRMVEDLRGAGIVPIACLAGAVRTMYETDLREPVALVVGGEKRGISAAMRALCAKRLAIPSKPGAASLSLTHAAAVVLAEAMRQRTRRESGVEGRESKT